MPTQVFQTQPSANAFSNFTQFCKNVKAIAEPYWYPTKAGERAFSEVMRAWGMLIFLVLLIILLVSTKVFNSFISCYLIDSLIEDKNYSIFINNLLLNLFGLAVAILLAWFSQSIGKKIALDWYKFMNSHISERYLSSRADDKVDGRTDVDRFAQHLLQEVEPIISTTLSFSAKSLEKILEIGTFLIIVWMISQQVAVIILIYTILGNSIAAYLNQELIKINQEEIDSKADYIYYVTHFQNNTDSIFFSQEGNNKSILSQHKFNNLIDKIERKINLERGKNLFIKGYQSFVQIFPFLLLSPLFIEGGIAIGQLLLAALACIIFSSALGELIGEFSIFGQFSSYAERLSEFSHALEEVTQQSENATVALFEPSTAAEFSPIQVNEITADIIEESNLLPIDDSLTAR